MLRGRRKEIPQVAELEDGKRLEEDALGMAKLSAQDTVQPPLQARAERQSSGVRPGCFCKVQKVEVEMKFSR